MTTTAVQRNIHVSPRKMKLVIDLIRNKKADKALVILGSTNKKCAPITAKLLKSAMANAVNNHAMDAESLYVYEITANQAPTMKRTLPRAKGSADRMLKRMTHLTITISDNPNERQVQLAAAKELRAQRKAKGDAKRLANKQNASKSNEVKA